MKVSCRSTFTRFYVPDIRADFSNDHNLHAQDDREFDLLWNLLEIIANPFSVIEKVKSH